jgi:hypothetical protein
VGGAMKRSLRWIALLSAASVALPCASFAQTSAQVASSWGLLGTWQVECGGAPSDTNPVYTYGANGAQVVLDRDFGDNRRDSNMVTGVRRTPSGEITYTVIFASTEPPQNREHVFLKSQNGRAMRIISNRNPDTNVYAVRDGKYSDDGQTTVWMNRCY